MTSWFLLLRIYKCQWLQFADLFVNMLKQSISLCAVDHKLTHKGAGPRLLDQHSFSKKEQSFISILFLLPRQECAPYAKPIGTLAPPFGSLWTAITNNCCWDVLVDVLSLKTPCHLGISLCQMTSVILWLAKWHCYHGVWLRSGVFPARIYPAVVRQHPLRQARLSCCGRLWPGSSCG